MTAQEAYKNFSKYSSSDNCVKIFKMQENYIAITDIQYLELQIKQINI